MIKTILILMHLFIGVVGGAVELALWCLAVAFQVLRGLVHRREHRDALRDAVLVCSAGHEVTLAGTHQCSECGFVSDDPSAALCCPNPYCEAPVAPYVVCDCGRSVVNPAARLVP